MNAAVSKTVSPANRARGFESPPLRHLPPAAGHTLRTPQWSPPAPVGGAGESFCSHICEWGVADAAFGVAVAAYAVVARLSAFLPAAPTTAAGVGHV